jgi:hypothetical protein
MTAPRHGLNTIKLPFETHSPRLEGITMEFVPNLPNSMASGHTGILVIVDRMTKVAICVPCRMDIDLPELAGVII